MLVENPNEKKATKSHRTLSTQKSKSGYNEEEGLVEWEAEVNKKKNCLGLSNFALRFQID